MGPITSFGGAYGTGLSYGGAGDFMGANQDRMGLANTVTGNETPDQLRNLQQRDLALEFKGLQGKMNYEVGNAMQEAAESRKQKDRAQRDRLFQMGAIFG